ncbi:hypothetical protein D3C86_1856740 [compost metagenome]
MSAFSSLLYSGSGSSRRKLSPIPAMKVASSGEGLSILSSTFRTESRKCSLFSGLIR